MQWFCYHSKIIDMLAIVAEYRQKWKWFNIFSTFWNRPLNNRHCFVRLSLYAFVWYHKSQDETYFERVTLCRWNFRFYYRSHWSTDTICCMCWGIMSAKIMITSRKTYRVSQMRLTNTRSARRWKSPGLSVRANDNRLHWKPPSMVMSAIFRASASLCPTYQKVDQRSSDASYEPLWISEAI